MGIKVDSVDLHISYKSYNTQKDVHFDKVMDRLEQLNYTSTCI